MGISFYDVGFEDASNGSVKKDRDTFFILLGIVYQGKVVNKDKLEYDNYSKGFDDGVEAVKKKKELESLMK
jgi:hypothetical protein